ncbi:hypothetical protein PLESTB_001603100 [Pleodorina starrii]|uniref:DUF6570 domain-containing protein n=1 Tax=Pleodorina starrii TaxID=330485 RepID=A0A9W6BY25_9CHLO|nr:hypothetical protein PLESTB_001603100 [Pleodorina starrii]GLC69404.1 hypothetical protein PLESTF_000826200 [Pleodorina starrii]
MRGDAAVRRHQQEDDSDAKERARKAARQRQRRADPEVRAKERAQQAARRRQRQADPELQAEDRARNAARQRQRRARAELQADEQDRNTVQRRKRRADPELQADEQDRNTAQRRQRRADPELQADEQDRNTVQRRQRRADPELQADEQDRNTVQRRQRRADPELQADEQDRNTVQRQERRTAARQTAAAEPALLDRLCNLLHLDYLYDERPVELPDFLAALPDGRVQDLPGGQLPPDRQVPYTAQLQAASNMAMALRRRMPSRVCAVCSELCSDEDSSVQSFNTIPNVDLLRADIMCTAAVSRCAHTLAWRRVACTAQGGVPPPPDPVLPFRYRARRNDQRANAGGEDSTGTDATTVLLDDDIRGAEEMSDACDEEEENRQQEQPQPSLPPELQPKPPRVLPRPCSEDGTCVEVPYCMRLEVNLPNRTMLVDAEGVERIFLCQNCESALIAGRIPEAALARLDPGDVPRVNHLGDPLPTPTFLESQVLSRARVMQQILVLHLAGRPPDVYPQAVRAHGVAIASADPRLWRGLLPARTADLAGSITVLCIDRVQNRHELRERVRSAPALQVRGAVIVAWVRFLQHAEDDEWGIDPVAMEEYERMGCAPYVPEELVDNAVGPTDQEVADVLRTTFMHDRTGNAAQRQTVGAAS